MRPSLAVARTRIRPYRRLHRARPMSPRAFRHIGLADRSEPGEAPRAEPPSRTASRCASSTCQGRNRRSWRQQRCRREATGTNTSARGGEFTRRELSPEGRAAMRSGRKRSLHSGDVGAARGSARPAVGGVSMGAPSLALPSAGQFTHERLCFDGYRPMRPTIARTRFSSRPCVQTKPPTAVADQRSAGTFIYVRVRTRGRPH